MIKSFKGQNINTIKISGKQKTIANVCPFLDTLNALPKMKRVIISDAEVLGFESNQDCGNDDLVKPLKPHTNEVQVLNTVWNFQDFSVIQIFREINFGESRSSKTAIFAIFEGLNFVKFVNFSFQKSL